MISQNEIDSGKKYIEKMQEENRQLHSKCGDLEVVAMMAKKEATDAKDALTVAHDINTSTTSSKDEAIKREGEASKLSVVSEANARSLVNKQASIESAYERLKEELAVAVMTANEAEGAAQKDRLAAKDVTNKLNDLTIRLGELQTSKDNEVSVLVAQLSEAEARVSESKQKAAAAEAIQKKVSSELTTVSNDLNGKLSQAGLEKKVVMDKAAQLEADLKRALKEEKEVRAQLSDYEQRVLSAHQEKETTLSELRVAKGQVESLSAENKQLAAEKKTLYLEVEALKAEVLKLTQEKSALDQSVKDITSRCNELSQQLMDVQTQLRVKVGEAETLAMRVADLENQLSSIPALKKETLAQKSKVRDLEDLVAALKAENARVTEAELKTRSELSTCLKLIEELKSQMTEQKVDFINQIGEVKREMEERLVETVRSFFVGTGAVRVRYGLLRVRYGLVRVR